jgi:hypothetical protein
MAAPEFVLPNGGGIAYGEFHLDPHSRDWLLHHVPEIADALTRGAAWVTLWDAMLDGEAQPADLVSLALQALPREKDEQNVQRILGYSTQAYWKFLSPDARQRVGAPLERAFRAGEPQRRMVQRAARSRVECRHAWLADERLVRARAGPGTGAVRD